MRKSYAIAMAAIIIAAALVCYCCGYYYNGCYCFHVEKALVKKCELFFMFSQSLCGPEHH
jgi:hypothetical protein